MLSPAGTLLFDAVAETFFLKLLLKIQFCFDRTHLFPIAINYSLSPFFCSIICALLTKAERQTFDDDNIGAWWHGVKYNFFPAFG